MTEPQRGHSARFRIDGEEAASFELRASSRGTEKADFGGVGGFDVWIREVRLARFARDGTDRLDEHSLGKFLGKVWLMEPHHFDRARRVGNHRLTDGDFALPGFSRVEFRDGAENGHRLSRDEPRDSRLAAALVIAHGEVIEKVADSEDSELLQCAYLRRREPEML